MAKQTKKKTGGKKKADKKKGLDKSFAAAIRAVESAWDSDDAWDHLEELAESCKCRVRWKYSRRRARRSGLTWLVVM